MDTSDLLPLAQTKIFQSMIGACQWVIQLGRFDIAVHIMSLSSFPAEPRQWHLDCMKRIYGYLYKFRFATIRIRTGMPDFSDLNVIDSDHWSNSPYAGARKDLPTNLPTPRGKPVKIYTYADANLYHAMLNGKTVTAILHFSNKTPFDWFSKKQQTAETATFGGERSAARTATEQLHQKTKILLSSAETFYLARILSILQVYLRSSYFPPPWWEWFTSKHDPLLYWWDDHPLWRISF